MERVQTLVRQKQYVGVVFCNCTLIENKTSVTSKFKVYIWKTKKLKYSEIHAMNS